jgi:hypothetical protein
MKFFLLIGGFLGFVLSFVASWNAGNAPASCVTAAAVGCLVGAILFRALHAVFFLTVRNHILNEITRQRNAAASNPGAAQ